MAIRISKTGAIYYDAPFTQEQPQSASCANPTAEAVALERVEAGRHAFVAGAGQVVGWCIKRDGGWYIGDRDGNSLAGPFGTLAGATSAGQQVFALPPPAPVSKSSPH